MRPRKDSTRAVEVEVEVEEGGGEELSLHLHLPRGPTSAKALLTSIGGRCRSGYDEFCLSSLSQSASILKTWSSRNMVSTLSFQDIKVPSPGFG